VPPFWKKTQFQGTKRDLDSDPKVIAQLGRLRRISKEATGKDWFLRWILSLSLMV